MQKKKSVKKYGHNIGLCFQVVVLVNDGSQEFFTKVSPRLGLCTGNWHRITGENFLSNTQKATKVMMKDSCKLKS